MARVDTPYGDIFAPDGPCRDDYPNIETYDQRGGYSLITLQAPAIRSLKDAEQALYRRMHPLAAKLKRNKGRHEYISVLAGSKRTCSQQASLYAQDSKRYANPDTTLHTRGLAIDVDQTQGRRKLRLIHRVLFARGWRQSRPVDEPWHYSYWFTA